MPPRKKNSTWFDPQISAQDRLSAFERLSPREQQLLKSTGYKPGGIPTVTQGNATLAGEENYARKELGKAWRSALTRRDLASVNDILRAMKGAEMFGLGDRAVWDLMEQVLQELEIKAFQAFRQFPSSANYIKCRAAMIRLDLIGGHDLPDYPVKPWPKCRIRPPLAAGSYVVVRGDTLSKIAERYYGEENLWDAIWESNSYEGSPDHISPGQRFMIYAG
jgi:nucleoid-associated protein YgaU